MVTRLLDEEMMTWPTQTVEDFKVRYFGESTRQIGVDETNDFIFGELHNALLHRLFDNLGAVAAAISLSELPPSPLLKGGSNLKTFCACLHFLQLERSSWTICAIF